MPSNKRVPDAPRPPAPAAEPTPERIPDLVRAAQQGDTEAFGRLYAHYRDTVFRYAYHRVGRSRALAEDITSETFLRALRHIDTFAWIGRDFGAWLITITRNQIADHYKSGRYRLETCTGQMPDRGDLEASPEDLVLQHLTNQTLLNAVAGLNDAQRECITLRFLNELNIAETARATNRTDRAVKTMQYRAMRTLNRILSSAGATA